MKKIFLTLILLPIVCAASSDSPEAQNAHFVISNQTKAIVYWKITGLEKQEEELRVTQQPAHYGSFQPLVEPELPDRLTVESGTLEPKYQMNFHTERHQIDLKISAGLFSKWIKFAHKFNGGAYAIVHDDTDDTSFVLRKMTPAASEDGAWNVYLGDDPLRPTSE